MSLSDELGYFSKLPWSEVTVVSYFVQKRVQLIGNPVELTYNCQDITFRTSRRSCASQHLSQRNSSEQIEQV